MDIKQLQQLLLAVVLWFAFVDLCQSGNTEEDNIPGVNSEFKVVVEAAREQCFYQYVQPNATFYVMFQVVRGGDGMAGFAVRHPKGMHVHPYEWKAQSDYSEEISSGGFYEVCIDNQFSRFAAKLVSVYISAFLSEEWDSYFKEIEELDISVENFTSTLTSVDSRINEIRKYQHHSRSDESRDFNLLQANQSYVQLWSLAQCAIIVLTTSLQVYFVRKLFDVKNVTPTSKPRA